MTMVDIRPHQANDYQSLPDMDTTDVGVLDSQDRACLDELGRFLVERGENERFGVTLLHSHFPISDDEIFVEVADHAARKLVMSPRTAPESRDVSPITVQLLPREQGGQVHAIGLEYATQDAFQDAIPVGDEDAKTLSGLAEILERRHSLGRFGVRLIHDPLALCDDELLLETCDLDARFLDSAAASIDDHRVADSVETFWRWTLEPVTGPNGAVAAQVCRHKCVKACLKDGDRHVKGDHS